MSHIPNYTLNTGANIPGIAIGTFAVPGPDAYKSVLHALKVGYRHVDTAAHYGNEVEVGRAIRDSGVPREEIFVTTKLHTKSFHDVRGAFEVSLNNLNVGYIDLYLMHFPVPILEDFMTLDHSITFSDAYVQMQELPKDQVKAIGVCNFDTVNLKILLDDPRVYVVPAVNQVELHPNLAQPRLLEANKKHGLVTEAYSTLAKGHAFNNPTLIKVAEKHGVSVSNVAVSWAVQRGTVALVKSVNPGRIEENLKIIQLDEDDLATIAEMQKDIVRLVNPWPDANWHHNNIDAK